METVLKALWVTLEPHLVGSSIVPNLMERAREVTVASVLPSGDELMVPYECSFEANWSWRRVSYPDPFVLTPAHVKEMMERHAISSSHSHSDSHSSNSGRGRFLRNFGCFFPLGVLSHEVIHLVQGMLQQIDSDPHSWSAEHDASYVRSTLLYAMCRGSPDSAGRKLLTEGGIWYDGLLESILIHDIDEASMFRASWSTDVRQSYIEWRDSLGQIKPDRKLISDDPRISNQIKVRTLVCFFFCFFLCLFREYQLICCCVVGMVCVVLFV